MDFSQITDDLFIGTTPRRKDYDALRGLGVRLVINMRLTRGPKPRSHDLHIQYLWLCTFDNPLIPIPLRALVRGVNAALEVIHHGGKIYVLEMLLDEKTGSGALLDLNMLVMTGGKERSLKAFDDLFAQAGLRRTQLRPLNPVVTIQIVEQAHS